MTGPMGLGVGTLSFDWNTITGFLTSPMIVPWWAQVNILIGSFLFAWVMVPIAYYSNLWDAKKFPIFSQALFATDGSSYDVKGILTNTMLDQTKYEAHGPLRLSVFFALTYGLGFAVLPPWSPIPGLYHRHKLVAQWKQSREHSEDIHHKLMQAYPEVPGWWYGSLFLIMTVVAIITCAVWEYKLPGGVSCWQSLFPPSSPSLLVLFKLLPTSNPALTSSLSMLLVTSFPAAPLPTSLSRPLVISMAQAMIFVGDLKLGHYMKVPPAPCSGPNCSVPSLPV